jgi:hypothetical protein
MINLLQVAANNETAQSIQDFPWGWFVIILIFAVVALFWALMKNLAKMSDAYKEFGEKYIAVSEREIEAKHEQDKSLSELASAIRKNTEVSRELSHLLKYSFQDLKHFLEKRLNEIEVKILEEIKVKNNDY